MREGDGERYQRLLNENGEPDLDLARQALSDLVAELPPVGAEYEDPATLYDAGWRPSRDPAADLALLRAVTAPEAAEVVKLPLALALAPVIFFPRAAPARPLWVLVWRAAHVPYHARAAATGRCCRCARRRRAPRRQRRRWCAR